MSAGVSGSQSKGTTSGYGTSGSSGSSTATQTPNNLPALQAGWDQAGNILDATNSQTPGLAASGTNLVAGATPQATTTAGAGANAAANFANGDFSTNSANQYLTPYANGSQVGTQNPGFQGVVNQTALALQPQIDGNMAAAGRYGSGANANAFATALTNATGNMSYQNYLQQQQNQLQAAGQLSNNNATGTQQQLQGASLTPSTTQNLFAPGAANTAAAYAPLLAYIQAITAGNAGGTQTASQQSEAAQRSSSSFSNDTTGEGVSV